jgi:cation diffusion facilitator CzcD-associated flavoprotein CzcO
MTKFGAEVTNIEDFAPRGEGVLTLANIGIGRREHNCVDITYNVREGATGAEVEKKIRARGVYIATGAQTKQRHMTFPGEEKFEGQVAYGSGNDLHEIIPNVQGKRVAIIGGGAFAIENARTMLLNGAAHVTIIHRSRMQVWPRSMHYLLSTEKDRKFGEYAKLYENAVNWAGHEVGGENLGVFMDPTARAQPTASDVFFAFSKMGLITLVRGEVVDCSAGSLFVTNQGKQTFNLGSPKQVDCGVMLKCVGWIDPEAGVKAIFPAFKNRSFVFLNSSPRVVFSCDPHYSHGEGQASTHAALMETTPIGYVKMFDIMSVHYV